MEKSDRKSRCYVQNAAFEEIDVDISYSENGREAFIETSVVAGKDLLPDSDIMENSSYGIGQMIGVAVDYGAKNIRINISPSCTADCGLGMLAALGACFYNQSGISFVPTGKTLKDVTDFDFSMMYPRLVGARFEAYYNESDFSKIDGYEYIKNLFIQKLSKQFPLEDGFMSCGGLGFAVVAGLEGTLSLQ